MPSVSIGVTGDIHLGCNLWGRVDAKTGMNTMVLKFLDEFDKTCDRMILRKVDVWALVGDIFHGPNPTNAVRERFALTVRRAVEAGIDVLAIPGNHDRPMAIGAKHSLAELAAMKIPRFTIQDKTGIFTVKGVLDIVCLPWQKSRAAVVTEAQLAYKHIEHPAIVIGHFGIDGAFSGAETKFELNGGESIPVGALTHERVLHAFLGHIHKRQRLFNAAMYVGSMDRVDMSERLEDKGSLLVEVETDGLTGRIVKVEDIPGTPQKYVQLDLDFRDGTTNSLSVVKDVAGAVVKIKVKCTASQRKMYDWGQLYEKLKSAHYVYPIDFEVEGTQRREAGTIVKSDMGTAKALEAWVNAQKLEAGLKKKTIEAGKALMADL